MASDRDIVGLQTQTAGEVNAGSQAAGVSGRDAHGSAALASLEASADCPLPVAERFVSVNGEGRAAGKLAAFIRFTGCNLACSYCDTMWANAPAAAECAERVSVADLVAWARETRVECITLTGGEPALQPEIPRLVRALLAGPGPLGRGLRVEIETNGAADLRELASLRGECASLPGSLTFTVDWKLPASGMEDRMLRENFALLDARDTVKFVCGGEGDLIRINIPEHKLELAVSDEELARRKAAWTPREPKVTTGYLKRYAKMVSSANKGAILEF